MGFDFVKHIMSVSGNLKELTSTGADSSGSEPEPGEAALYRVHYTEGSWKGTSFEFSEEVDASNEFADTKP